MSLQTDSSIQTQTYHNPNPDTPITPLYQPTPSVVDVFLSKTDSQGMPSVYPDLKERAQALNPNPPGNSWDLNGPFKKLTLCDPVNAQIVLEECDPFAHSSEMWKRLIAKQKTGPLPSTQELDRIFIESFKSWFFYENIFLKAAQEINAAFSAKGIQLDTKTEHLRIYLTNGAENAHVGHYTRDNSIFLISDAGGFYKLPFFAALQFVFLPVHQEILKHITHEFFHVWSRAHPHKQENLYAALDFIPCPNLEIPEELSLRLFDNPDPPYFVYTTMKTSDNTTVLAVPLSLIDIKKCTFDGHFKRTTGEIPLPDYLEVMWIEVVKDPATGVISVLRDQNNRYRCVTPPDLSLKYGVDYTIHPEEILAELFVHWVWAEIIDWKKKGEEKKAACEKYFPIFESFFTEAK
jgi:hypothetical protein